MKGNDVLLSAESAATYYKKLIDNHVSSGTCEQRIMILRLRFDNILYELLPEIDKEEQSFYQKKLELIFEDPRMVFPENIQTDTKALTQLLNKIQHSELAADEELYLNCLKKLVNFISFCSQTDVPRDLKNTFSQNKNENIGILPLSICVDTKDVVFNNDLHKSLVDFVTKVTKEYPIEVEVLPIGNLLINKNKIGTLVSNHLVAESLKNVSSFVSDNIRTIQKQKAKCFNPPSLTVVLLSSEMLDNMSNIPNEFLKQTEDGMIATIVIGLNPEIDENDVKKLFPKIMGFKHLQNGKYKEMFAWLSIILDQFCQHSNL